MKLSKKKTRVLIPEKSVQWQVGADSTPLRKPICSVSVKYCLARIFVRDLIFLIFNFIVQRRDLHAYCSRVQRARQVDYSRQKLTDGHLASSNQIIVIITIISNTILTRGTIRRVRPRYNVSSPQSPSFVAVVGRRVHVPLYERIPPQRTATTTTTYRHRALLLFHFLRALTGLPALVKADRTCHCVL